MAKGRDPENAGIYTNWLQCSAFVTHVSGAKFHGTVTIDEAVRDLQLEGINPVVFHNGNMLSVKEYTQINSGVVDQDIANEIPGSPCQSEAPDTATPYDASQEIGISPPQDTHQVPHPLTPTAPIDDAQDTYIKVPWTEGMISDYIDTQVEYPLTPTSPTDDLQETCVKSRLTQGVSGASTEAHCTISADSIELSSALSPESIHNCETPVNHILNHAEDILNKVALKTLSRKGVTMKKSPKKKATIYLPLQSDPNIKSKLVTMEKAIMDLQTREYNTVTYAQLTKENESLHAELRRLTDVVNKLQSTIVGFSGLTYQMENACKLMRENDPSKIRIPPKPHTSTKSVEVQATLSYPNQPYPTLEPPPPCPLTPTAPPHENTPTPSDETVEQSENTPPPSDETLEQSEMYMDQEDPLVHGNVIIDSKSQFQGFGAHVYSTDDVNRFLETVKTIPKCVTASHHIVAYRLSPQDGDNPTESCMDGGETGAGAKLLRMLQELNIIDTVVVVCRWYGGTHLGNNRFNVIIKAAKHVLGKLGKPTTNDAIVSPITTINRFQPLSDHSVNQSNSPHSSNGNPNRSSEPIDNLLIHDSTGSKLVLNKLYPRGETSRKKWASYLQDARHIIESGPVVKRSIVVMCGIRDATELSQGWQWSGGSTDKLLFSIVQAARRKSPDATLVLVSVAPSLDSKIEEQVQSINHFMENQEIKNPSAVVYCNIYRWLADHPTALVGPHVKPQFLGTVANRLKVAVGITKHNKSSRAPGTNSPNNSARSRVGILHRQYRRDTNSAALGSSASDYNVRFGAQHNNHTYSRPATESTQQWSPLVAADRGTQCTQAVSSPTTYTVNQAVAPSQVQDLQTVFPPAQTNNPFLTMANVDNVKTLPQQYTGAIYYANGAAWQQVPIQGAQQSMSY